MGCCFSTSSGTVRIVERLGRFSSVARPGFTCIMPCIDSVSGTLSLRLQEKKIQVNCKTLDNVFVDVEVAVQYMVVSDRIEDAFYKLHNPVAVMQSYVYDVIRAEVPKVKLDDLFTMKDQLSEKVKSEVSGSMHPYGYKLLNTPLTDITPDAGVRAAMNEINKQERLKIAAHEEGEGRKVMTVKAAEARAERTRIEAAADADSKHLAGQGLSRQRQALVDGLSASVKSFTEGMNSVHPKEVMEMIITTQYFDTMKDIAQNSKSSTIFLPHEPGAVRNLAEQIRSGMAEAAREGMTDD